MADPKQALTQDPPTSFSPASSLPSAPPPEEAPPTEEAPEEGTLSLWQQEHVPASCAALESYFGQLFMTTRPVGPGACTIQDVIYMTETWSFFLFLINGQGT